MPPPELQGLGSPEGGGCLGLIVNVDELLPGPRSVSSAIRKHRVDRK